MQNSVNFKQLSHSLPLDKISWTNYFFSIALIVSSRADCTRRQFGCVIVSPDNRIIATGYNSPPRGELSFVQRTKFSLQDSFDRCKFRDCCKSNGEEAGKSYDSCNAIHAEQNALLQLGQNTYPYTTMYLVGRDGVTGEILSDSRPCIYCSRIIKNSNVKKIYCLNDETGNFNVLTREDLVTVSK